MDRRDFLRIGAAGASGLVVLGSSSCATLPKLPAGRLQAAALPDMDSYLARVDNGMETIARWSPSSEFPAKAADPAAADSLARMSLRTLYMTAMFSDLPEEGQRHPGMQERVWNTMPEMDRAASAMTEFLEAQTPEDLRRLQRALRHPSNPSMEFLAALDEQAAVCGLSGPRRLQTRVLMTEASWRLRNQPPALVIGETLDRVRKVYASDVRREAREDVVAGRVGEEVFWDRRELLRPSREPEKADDDPRPLRTRRIERGGKLMGIGLVVGGIAIGLTAAGAFPFVFVATAGAVLFVIGLFTVLVGLATSSDAR